MYDALAEAAVEVVLEHYFESMSAEEKAELKALLVKKFRAVLESMRERTGEEVGISY